MSQNEFFKIVIILSVLLGKGIRYMEVRKKEKNNNNYSLIPYTFIPLCFLIVTRFIICHENPVLL